MGVFDTAEMNLKQYSIVGSRIFLKDPNKYLLNVHFEINLNLVNSLTFCKQIVRKGWTTITAVKLVKAIM